MDENRLRFQVGAMIITSLILLGILLAVFGELPSIIPFLGNDTYQVEIHFPRAPGMAPDTPVRQFGLLIGRVYKVDFSKQGGVLVTARIDSKRRLRKDVTCHIRANLLGDAEIEFVPSGTQDAPFLEAGDLIEGAPPSNTLELLADIGGRLPETFDSIDVAGREIGRLAKQLNQSFEKNQPQFHRIMVKTETALDGFNGVVQRVDNVVGDEQLLANLRQSVVSIPRIVKNVEAAVQDMRNTIKTADENLQNLKGFTQPLGESGSHIVASLEKTLEGLNGITEEFRLLGVAVRTGDGTVGQLINNPDLYQNLNAAATNLRILTQQLEPILGDVRVLTDKLAREPGRVIQGAIRKPSLVK